jgi:hypothetical protein
MNRKMTKDMITKKQWWWIFVSYNTSQRPKLMKDQQNNHEMAMVPVTWQWTSNGSKKLPLI